MENAAENSGNSPVKSSPSKGLIILLIIIIFVLAISLIGIGGYMLGQKNNQPKKQSVVQSALPSPIPTQEPSITPSVPTPTIDEESLLKQTIKTALVAEHGSQASSLNITVSKIEGDYASGAASEQGGGGMWFAAKVNGIWKLVWDGNGMILCSSLTSYPSYPADMIPECWNDKTESVKR
jgi:hypothetical protein